MSLRVSLLLLLGAVWLVFGGAVTLWMFQQASVELDAALDSRLAASAAMVARLVTQLPRVAVDPAGEMPASAGPLLREGVACEISELAGDTPGRTLARVPGGPALDAAPPGFGSLAQLGGLWRTYVIECDGLRIATAGRMDIRAGLHRQMAWTALLPGVAGLAVGLVLLWFGVGHGLARLSRRMEDVLRRERRFSDHAAHEMRSPLTAIKAHLQVLQRLPAAAGDPASRQAVTHALQGTARLERMIEQLLLLARADGDDDGGAACDAFTVLERVAARKPARVRWRLPDGRPWVALPDALLDCAVRNLVDNALKYSPETAEVCVDVTVAAAELVVMVHDQGPGLTPVQCAQALEPFWRGGRQGEGAGLGLSIVAAIARRHGGTLALTSVPGAGLRCRFGVPLAEVASVSPRSANSGD